MAASLLDRTIQLFSSNASRLDKLKTKAASDTSSNYLVTALAWGPSSELLAVGQSDNVIFIYRLDKSGKKSICNKILFSAAVSQLCWPPNSPQAVLCGCVDGKVSLGLCHMFLFSAWPCAILSQVQSGPVTSSCKQCRPAGASWFTRVQQRDHTASGRVSRGPSYFPRRSGLVHRPPGWLDLQVLTQQACTAKCSPGRHDSRPPQPKLSLVSGSTTARVPGSTQYSKGFMPLSASPENLVTL